MEKGNKDKESNLSDVIGGTLNIFGLKIDLGKLLSSPEELRGQLEELRERLKEAGLKETLSDEEWRSGGATITGFLRTRGILGEREYHIGAGPSPRGPRPQREPLPEAVEPATDVFHEAQEIIVVAEVPGVELEDLELAVEGNVLSLRTKPAARRNYRKEVELGSGVDRGSLKASYRNGLLEIHLRKIEP